MVLLVIARFGFASDSNEVLLSPSRLPEESQPGNRTPAPGELRLVQAFVNTLWYRGRRREEVIASPPALRAWLGARGLIEPGTRLGLADLTRAWEVREGLRALLLVNNGAAVDGEAIERLNRALHRPRVFVQLNADVQPAFIAPRGDLDGALASLAMIVAVAQVSGQWSRFKACRGHHCGWAFYDHSRNQSGNWCAMSICGARAKARDYRSRKRRSKIH
jgi:putative stress-induced transcription regulator/CGNR zinc finger protein